MFFRVHYLRKAKIAPSSFTVPIMTSTFFLRCSLTRRIGSFMRRFGCTLGAIMNGKKPTVCSQDIKKFSKYVSEVCKEAIRPSDLLALLVILVGL